MIKESRSLLVEYFKSHRNVLNGILKLGNMPAKKFYFLPHVIMVQNYLKSSIPKKFHVGCGHNIFERIV